MFSMELTFPRDSIVRLERTFAELNQLEEDLKVHRDKGWCMSYPCLVSHWDLYFIISSDLHAMCCRLVHLKMLETKCSQQEY